MQMALQLLSLPRPPSHSVSTSSHSLSSRVTPSLKPPAQLPIHTHHPGNFMDVSSYLHSSFQACGGNAANPGSRTVHCGMGARESDGIASAIRPILQLPGSVELARWRWGVIVSFSLWLRVVLLPCLGELRVSDTFRDIRLLLYPWLIEEPDHRSIGTRQPNEEWNDRDIMARSTWPVPLATSGQTRQPTSREASCSLCLLGQRDTIHSKAW